MIELLRTTQIAFFKIAMPCGFFRGGRRRGTKIIRARARASENPMNYTVWENYLSMIIITTKQNKQHGSKSTNYNLQTWSEFPERSVRVSTEGENKNIRHIVDLREHVIAKCGNGSKEIAGRWQINVQLVSDIMSPGHY